MRWLHFCLLITLLPLFSASSSQAQQDYTGVWAGTTSQNETITMVVSGRTLQAVVVRVHIQGGEPDWCTGQVLFLASNFDTGLYYMDGPAIELFWEQEGAHLTLGALIDQDQAHGTVNLATTSSRHPPVCQGVGSADFTAGNGAPYAGGRAPRPTAPPPPPPPTTQPDTGPRPTARPTQVGQPTTGPQPSPTNTVVPGTVIGDRVSPPWWPCEEGQVKGNRNSMIYHTPDGQFYDRTYEDVECFDTAAEAEAAGYRSSER